MSDPELRLAVPGLPRPQGSKRHVGKGIMVEMGGQPLKDWRYDIKQSALQMDVTPRSGPIELTMHFYMPRPKSHFGRRGLLPSAPTRPATRPDLDKLIRAVLDALTGVWYGDDAQIVGLLVREWYADDSHRTAGVTIEQEAV